MKLDKITKEWLLEYVNDVLIQQGRPLDKSNIVITTYLPSKDDTIVIKEHDTIDSVINELNLNNNTNTFFVDYKLLDEYISLVYCDIYSDADGDDVYFDFSYFGDAYKSNTAEKISGYEYEDILKKDSLIKLMGKI